MEQEPVIVVLFGASGDLASKKILPAFWGLYKLGQFNVSHRVSGFARTKKTQDEFINSFKSYCKVLEHEEKIFSDFCKILTYYSGDYQDESFIKFNTYLSTVSSEGIQNRVFYFALPPSTYTVVASLAKKHCISHTGYTRVVLEKPFGYDLESAKALNKTILELYAEKDIYRIDHYLGKEMVQNILAIRFANLVISSLWCKDYISNVVLTFKEDIGTYGRGHYYDNSGVIRDIIQNHMIQVLSLVAMEQPATLSHSDIKDAKSKVLKEVLPIQMENVVVGQYVGDPQVSEDLQRLKGYKDDESVPKDSVTPTFANIIMYIDNDRWRGIPFILKAGKALNERKAEIRIQFKTMENKIFEKQSINELVIRMQPNEAIYLKMLLKMPGPGFEMAVSELDLTYKDRHQEFVVQDAYEKLILDVLVGSHINFVRSDELEESWRIFTPLLQKLEKDKVEPVKYIFGSRGPNEADVINQKAGFKYDPTYKWKK